MSASARSHTRTYLVPLDGPWTSFGRNWDVNGTSDMRNKRLVQYETQNSQIIQLQYETQNSLTDQAQYENQNRKFNQCISNRTLR
ncbi:hypothetical protein OUZ56_010419 [Daphnia magna]|uniref:Uncharacterized protein n=1 Tax=Daphnia magna TaxID=35525 RepID=A0ABR0AIH1_9CRUS|nr:hypothetical protein OUZ56_010419 [Daphnia magna]